MNKIKYLLGNKTLAMCGIAGYVGGKEAGKILLEIIKKTEKLEERPGGGAGIAAIYRGRLSVRKDAGFVEEVEKKVKLSEIEGSIGIAHNRSYPRTGAASEVNAHPHLDCKGEIAVVHAGNIDNFEEIQRQLENEGHKLISRIDTAVIPHVIEKHYKNNLAEAVKKATCGFKGEYAFLALSKREPDKIVGVMRGRPLAAGKGEGFCIFSSDAASIKNAKIKELDNEIAVITKEKVQHAD